MTFILLSASALPYSMGSDAALCRALSRLFDAEDHMCLPAPSTEVLWKPRRGQLLCMHFMGQSAEGLVCKADEQALAACSAVSTCTMALCSVADVPCSLLAGVVWKVN